MRQSGWQQNVNNQNTSRIAFSYLVVHPEANDLGQEGPSKARSDQLFVGTTQSWLKQALPNDSTSKLIHFEPQVGWPISVRVHLREARKRDASSFKPEQKGKNKKKKKNGWLTRPWLLSLNRVKSWLEVSKRVLQISSNHSRRGPPQSSAKEKEQDYTCLLKLLLRTKQWKFKCFLHLPHPETQPRSSYSSQTQRSSAWSSRTTGNKQYL